jgi:putative restriction endonuclease
MAKQASIFGDLPGIREGHEFLNRLELSAAGVHRPTRAGIGARSGVGADSIVLSGMYEDDQDHGHVILYTGQGGRSSSSGEQVADQTLTGANLELVRSYTEQLPVRVTRRAVTSGGHFFRYDGLYRITAYWQETGKSGHLVWRFRLEKLALTETNANSSPTI